MGNLTAAPIELRDANEFVAALHRHHQPVVRDKFRVAATLDGRIVGVCQIARPKSRMLDDGTTVEVVRLCTDETHNACSFLYGKAARIAKEMGYRHIITYILDSEDGASLRAVGWDKETETRGGSWSCPSRPRQDNAPTCPKQRWGRYL